jgi:hypothetical protein
VQRVSGSGFGQTHIAILFDAHPLGAGRAKHDGLVHISHVTETGQVDATTGGRAGTTTRGQAQESRIRGKRVTVTAYFGRDDGGRKSGSIRVFVNSARQSDATAPCLQPGRSFRYSATRNDAIGKDRGTGIVNTQALGTRRTHDNVSIHIAHGTGA